MSPQVSHYTQVLTQHIWTVPCIGGFARIGDVQAAHAQAAEEAHKLGMTVEGEDWLQVRPGDGGNSLELSFVTSTKLQSDPPTDSWATPGAA